MPMRGRSRLVAKRLLDTTAEDNDLDYFGQFTKRARPNNDSNGQASSSKVPRQQLDDRAARRARREAGKLGQTPEVPVQRVSPRRGNVQWSEEDDNEDDNEDGHEDDNEDESEDLGEEGDDDDGGVDGVDHARITRAMNAARNRTTKPTINGIGSRQRKNQVHHTEASSDDGGDSQEEPLSRSPEGDDPSSKAPQQQKQQNHNRRGRPSQKRDTNNPSPDEDESGTEFSSEVDDQFVEDAAFVEAPHQGEKTETVKVIINSMGGIFKTLQHPAWTGLTHWASEFGSDKNDDGHKTCKARSGRDLMDELQGLNNILDESIEPPEESAEDDYDFTETAIAFLRTQSEDVEQHLTRIDKIVGKICSRKLLPVPRVGNPGSLAQAAKKRKVLLQDLAHRLIPMLIVTVEKACGICLSEDNRSKTTLYLDCFRLQFLLRPLAWADRLHKALERGLEQGIGDDESQSDAESPEEGWSMAQDSKQKARSALGPQLDALYSAGRKAEREIQAIATRAEREEREAEIKRQNRERAVERQREIAAEKQRQQDEQKRRDDKMLRAFIEGTHALRSKDALKDLWDQSQARLPEQFRATSTVRAAPVGNSAGHGQSTAGAALSRGGPSRNARVEPASDPDDPFSDNYRPRTKTPASNRHTAGGGPSRNARVEPASDPDDPFSDNYRPRTKPSASNRHTAGNGVQQNTPVGLGRSQRARNASEAWSEKEERAMILAIRYKRNYDVVLMAQKLRRSEDDVARKAAFLKQAYREAYTQKGVEIPAWAL